jgi:hypothetical protein
MDVKEKLVVYAYLVWIVTLAVFVITVTYIMYATLTETSPFAILVSHVNSDASATSFTIQLVFQNQSDSNASVWITSIKLDGVSYWESFNWLMTADTALRIVVPGNQTSTLHFHLSAQSFDKKHFYSVPFNVTPIRNGTT